jgi:hypothetical protein
MRRKDRLLCRKARKDNAARNDGEANVVIARRPEIAFKSTKQSGHVVIARRPEIAFKSTKQSLIEL